MQYKNENDVNYYVKEKLDELGLVKGEDYNDETGMSNYLKEALKGSSKTEKKSSFGIPDFHVEKYSVPVIIENKKGLKKLIAKNKDAIKDDDKSISDYAVNGAIHYGTSAIASGSYKDVVVIGIAGDSKEDIEIKIYYIYGNTFKEVKLMERYNTLNFLENQKSFNSFYKEAVLTEEEKHEILIKTQEELKTHSKKLNKLMHNHNITAPQRVLYVSGMLLSMQDIKDDKNNLILEGLTPKNLKGVKNTTKNRDGLKIYNQIEDFLKEKNIPDNKKKLMLSSFREISKDIQRDEKEELDKEVDKLLSADASINKQIFTYIYENIYKSIDNKSGHLDIMGEMYSEFLKYALGDGKEIGIVLTPPYVTKMMANMLDINQDSKVMDLATGSAGFLISAMEIMIEDAERVGKHTNESTEKIKEIKKNQLLGIELNAEMYTLASTNMILRGDGSSRIEKGNTFNRPEEIYTNFKANKILLNPPFSYEENGMPFIEFGLNKMEKGGLGAIIIQDSAGSGRAVATNKKILKNHTLKTSIKMPTDLFMPNAGVQTSIYIFEAHKKHDYETNVKFIDFRNDGYKRTKRGLQEIDSPTNRYSDILKIYKNGLSTKKETLKVDWNLKDIVIEEQITDSGADWNFDQHKKIDTNPTTEDFRKTVSDYLSWEVEQIIKDINKEGK